MTLTESVTTGAERTGKASRFGARWRLIGAGLSNVWRYGDLELPAVSGRLLLRGPNGTGKTTALEVLWPFLLDLKQERLSAGKARFTNLTNLMREGAESTNRVGYVWASFAAPGDNHVVSYGVRLNFSKSGTPPVKVIPFFVPGRPLHELAVWGPARQALTADGFRDAVSDAGGVVFDGKEQYLHDMATRLFACEAGALDVLAERIRAVRNPALLAETSPAGAADALRASLPGVSDEVIVNTGEALAESEITRRAFEQDRRCAEAIGEVVRGWNGHVVDVVTRSVAAAHEVEERIKVLERSLEDLTRKRERHSSRGAELSGKIEELRRESTDLTGRSEGIKQSDAYQAAGRLDDLRKTVEAQTRTAEAEWDRLEQAVRHDITRTVDLRRRVNELKVDFSEQAETAASDDRELVAPGVVAWTERQRPDLRIEDRVLGVGPEGQLSIDLEGLDAYVVSLASRSQAAQDRADAAGVFLIALGEVERQEAGAGTAREKAADLAVVAERRRAALREADEALRVAAAALRQALLDYSGFLPDDAGWAREDVEDADWTDAAAVLGVVEDWRERTQTWAHGGAARLETRAEGCDVEATAQRGQADTLRTEADQIRTEGRLLPLPRPEWAGAGDDGRALGSVLEWADGVDPSTQDLVEATLGAAGVLGATLDPAGVSTATWSVSSTGPLAMHNLASLVRADDDHPLAGAAHDVLARIAVVDNALGEDSPGLVIGLNGTFRAGVLCARVDQVNVAEAWPPAHHIGARRRRDAALEHARRLEAEAEELDSLAGELERQAAQLRADAQAMATLVERFPPTRDLRDAETVRSRCDRDAHDAEVSADSAEREATRLADEAKEARREWSQKVVHKGLSPNRMQLEVTQHRDGAMAGVLSGVQRRVGGTIRGRLVDLASEVEQSAPEDLDELSGVARSAVGGAREIAATYETLQETAGTAAREAIAELSRLTARLSVIKTEHAQVVEDERRAGEAIASTDALLGSTGAALAEAQPARDQAIAAIRTLLAIPGVAQVLLDSDPATDPSDLLAQVGAGLRGKATFQRKTVLDRIDAARAVLAGVWSVDPGQDHPELLAYVLTHNDTSYTPPDALARAEDLAEDAETALRDREESALRDFVVGTLPGAINGAWTRLHDWRDQVNKKMRQAQSSSGVGVTVRISVRDDLSTQARFVYENVCDSQRALTNTEIGAQVGAALQALINAAPGEDMVERVSEAVDIREWVDVRYLVTRSGQEPRTWNKRTGLSGGERRLVILAPMLAAVAAAYDGFVEGAPRLAALDEVPAEVDEEGREGLARYIAELDLDLIATSHLWDGAPGAWDGVDAYDLEAAPDGTVIGFPMMIRGAPLPGDELDSLREPH